MKTMGGVESRNAFLAHFFLSFFENFCNISDLITYNCTLKCFLLIIVNLNIVHYGKVGINKQHARKHQTITC